MNNNVTLCEINMEIWSSYIIINRNTTIYFYPVIMHGNSSHRYVRSIKNIHSLVYHPRQVKAIYNNNITLV